MDAQHLSWEKLNGVKLEQRCKTGEVAIRKVQPLPLQHTLQLWARTRNFEYIPQPTYKQRSRDAKQERSQLRKCSLQVSNYHCHCFSWLATCTHFMHTLCNFGPELTTSKLRWSKVAKRSCTHFMQTHMHCYFWPELATMRTPSYIQATCMWIWRTLRSRWWWGRRDEGGWN